MNSTLSNPMGTKVLETNTMVITTYILINTRKYFLEVGFLRSGYIKIWITTHPYGHGHWMSNVVLMFDNTAVNIFSDKKIYKYVYLKPRRSRRRHFISPSDLILVSQKAWINTVHPYQFCYRQQCTLVIEYENWKYFERTWMYWTYQHLEQIVEETFVTPITCVRQGSLIAHCWL